MRSSVVTWQPSRLQELLRERGWTMREFSALIDLPAGSLRSYVHGGYSPGPPVLVRMARALHVETTELAPLSDAVTLHELRWHTGLTVAEVAVEVGISAGRAGLLLRAEDRITDTDTWCRVLATTPEGLEDAWRNSRLASLPPQ